MSEDNQKIDKPRVFSSQRLEGLQKMREAKAAKASLAAEKKKM